MTYNEMATKDDKAFLAHAKRVLRGDYNFVMDDARKAFQSHSQPSKAKQAANLVILAALKEIGEEHWRKPKEQVERRPLNQNAMPPQRESKKKWEGKSILEMMDEKKKGA